MRIIVVGGLSAGPSAAAKARRTNENAEILLFEKTRYVSYATCGIPYGLSGKISDRGKLVVVTEELLRARFNIDVHMEEPIMDILPEEHKVITQKGTYHYDKLVYAAGTIAITPPIEGIFDAVNWSHSRTLDDFDHLMNSAITDNVKHVTVVGAGLIGLEVAENLKKSGKDVTLVELAPQVLPPWDYKFARFAEIVLMQNDVHLVTGNGLSGVKVEEGKIREAFVSDEIKWNTDYVIIGTGGRPNTQMLTRKGAKSLKNGALIVNERMETSLQDIYAAGDCASIKNLVNDQASYFPMGTHSNKGGRAAGENAAGGHTIFKGAYGTAIVKFFGHTLARTGMNTQTLLANEIPFSSTFLIGPSGPGFYPDQKDIFMEIFYDPNTRRLLGAELFGEKGIDKRVDVLSTAIFARLTLDDIQQLDLAYAPPFSPAKDPVVMAGYIASNSLKGYYNEIYPNSLNNMMQASLSETVILDVREPAELQDLGKIRGAINIPLDHLRHNLDTLDKEKSYIIYCMRGLRGYIAALILYHHGFGNLFNLVGGFMHWKKAGYPIYKKDIEEKITSI